MNMCVLRGVVVGEPRITDLPSGERALTFDVKAHVEGTPRASVPVEWTGATTKMPRVLADDSVAVVGSVARRFYRSGGTIQTRVYISPEKIVVKQPKRQTTALAHALESSLGVLDAERAT